METETTGADRTRVIRDSRDERVTRDATWFDVRLVASLVAPRDARRVPREEQKRAASREKNKNEPRTETTELDSEEERAFSFRGNGGDVGDVDALDASLTRAALAATASALGGSFKREPATGPVAVGDGFACAFPLLAHSALPFGEDDDDDADAESFRLDPKLPELSFPASLERSLRDTPGNSTSREKSVRNPRTTRLEAVFHPSVSSGRRAHFRRILETTPGGRDHRQNRRGGGGGRGRGSARGELRARRVRVPDGSETTAAARAAVAARETSARAPRRTRETRSRGARCSWQPSAGTRTRRRRARGSRTPAPATTTSHVLRRPARVARVAARGDARVAGEDGPGDETARAPFCSSFEFVAAASPGHPRDTRRALPRRRGAEAAAAAAAADAAARRERAAAASARRVVPRSRRRPLAPLSDRADDGEFAEIRGNRPRALRARVPEAARRRRLARGPALPKERKRARRRRARRTPPRAERGERRRCRRRRAPPPTQLRRRRARPTGRRRTRLPGSPRASPARRRARASRACALVVDDNHFQLRIVKASLKRSGVELDAAVHGREAVELFEKRLKAIRDVGFDDAENRLATKPPYDVILMDSMMPVMDGCAATIEIRAAERAFRATLPAALLKPGGTFERETMIIGLSAEAGPEYEAGAREAGMDGALGKPCRPEALRTRCGGSTRAPSTRGRRAPSAGRCTFRRVATSSATSKKRLRKRFSVRLRTRPIFACSQCAWKRLF